MYGLLPDLNLENSHYSTYYRTILATLRRKPVCFEKTRENINVKRNIKI